MVMEGEVGRQVRKQILCMLVEFSTNNKSEYMGIHCTVLSTFLYVWKFS